MAEVALIGLTIVILFIVLHLRPLSAAEIDSLALKRRDLEIRHFFSWSNIEIIPNQDFKSAMNKNGALHSISQPLSTFPALGAGLLKSKKHEWIILAFAKDRTVELLYFNKGPDNDSVTPSLSTLQVLELIRRVNASTVLCLHNHPNGVLQPSPQDHASADRLAGVLNSIGVSLVEFVCCRGRFVQYYQSASDKAFPVMKHNADILRVNGQSHMTNLRLHLERVS